MKRCIWLLLCATAWAASPKTLTSTVAFTDPQNNTLANGSIVFTLNQGANVIGGGQLVQGLTVTVTLSGAGLVSGGPTIWANDQLQPTGTAYIVKIYNSNGLLVRGPENWILSGASPIDLSIQTNSALPDPGLSNPVLQNPSASQTITGQSLTLSSSAALTVASSVTISSATTATSAQVVGNPIPLVAKTLQKAESGSADTNVLTYTPPAAAGLYRVCYMADVSAATAGVVGFTLNWTDSNGNVQAAVAQSLFLSGTAAPALTFTTSIPADFYNCAEIDINNAAANIIVKWVGGGTTTALVTATVERLI